MFNDKSKIIFVLGKLGGFYEGGISMKSRYCPMPIDGNYQVIALFLPWQ